MAASLPPPLEFFNIEQTEQEHVPLEETRQKLDEIQEYFNEDDDLHSNHNTNPNSNESVPSESEIANTNTDDHEFISIQSTWPKGKQAIMNKRNKNKKRSLAQKKLIKEKPPNKRAKGFVSCPWKELGVTQRKPSYVTAV